VEQTPVDKALQILHSHGGEGPWVAGSEDVHFLDHYEMRRRGWQGTRISYSSQHSLCPRPKNLEWRRLGIQVRGKSQGHLPPPIYIRGANEPTEIKVEPPPHI
jgi:hypothetical protein